MPAITTLNAVKAKLCVDPADTSRDDAIGAVLDGVEAFVLDRTGFTTSAGPFADRFRNAQEGRTLQLARRPVAEVSAAEGRHPGSSEWTTLVADLVDAQKGHVVLVGSEGLGDWPPRAGRAPWFRWQEPVWPVARVTYTVTPTAPGTFPPDLADATAAWVAYLYERQLAGAQSESWVWQERTAYLEASMPVWVQSVIHKHMLRRPMWA